MHSMTSPSQGNHDGGDGIAPSSISKRQAVMPGASTEVYKARVQVAGGNRLAPAANCSEWLGGEVL